jgi:uridine phosphorylase
MKKQPRLPTMSFPILEFDPAPEAFIEPGRVIRRRDVPEHCVICFFKDVLDEVIVQHNARVAAEHRSEAGDHPLYEIEHQGRRLAFFHPGVGAPLAAGLLEEVIARGCRKFIACGGCGVLDKEISVGRLVVLTGAIRDEGVSYHYLPPARRVDADPAALKVLTAALQQREVPFLQGLAWTTDAFYRETLQRIARRRQEGCLVVEMEAAALMAVAQFRGAAFAQVVYGGDDLSGAHWDGRGWQSRSEVRRSLFWLCAEACLAL